MDNTHREESFTYTYSAKQQEEINRIRQKYQPPAEDKFLQLKKLDRAVNDKAVAKSLAVGILGAIVMGTGMSLAMTDIGTVLEMTEFVSMAAGIMIGLIGMLIAAVAYPVYNRTLVKERRRAADEIIRLSDELMK